MTTKMSLGKKVALAFAVVAGLAGLNEGAKYFRHLGFEEGFKEGVADGTQSTKDSFGLCLGTDTTLAFKKHVENPAEVKMPEVSESYVRCGKLMLGVK